MVSTKSTLLTSIAVACSLALVPGCFFVEGNVKVNVDGSAEVEMSVAVSQALAELSEGDADPFGEFQEGMPENWTAEPLEEEGRKGVVVRGTAPAGGQLIPQGEGEESNVNVRIVKRLLSTEYVVEGTVSMGDVSKDEAEEAAASTGTIVFTQAREEEENEETEGWDDELGDAGEMFNPEALMGLFAGGAQQPQVSFSVKAPGTLVETTGTPTDDGAAKWVLDITSMMGREEPPTLEVLLRTRLLNHQNIGRLADRLAAERDMPDMAALIGDYVMRGLLPNPPKEAPLKAGLDAEAFENAIKTIVAFESVIGEVPTARVVNGLKLNADDITARRLRETWELVADMDEEELVEVVGEAVVKHVKMLSR